MAVSHLGKTHSICGHIAGSFLRWGSLSLCTDLGKRLWVLLQFLPRNLGFFQLCLSNGTFVGCPTISFLEIFACFLYMTIRCHSISVAHCGPTSSLGVKLSHPAFSAIGILLFPLRSNNPIHLHIPNCHLQSIVDNHCKPFKDFLMP